MVDIHGLFISILHSLAPDEWTALNVILSGVVAVGIVYGYYSLQEMARNQRLSSAKILYEELEKTEKDRREIIKKISTFSNVIDETFDCKTMDVSLFSEEETLKIRNIINSFNRIGLLIETDTISQTLVLGICYPAIIQSWAICEAYANHYEKKIGVPYARRVERLAFMAQNYFDSNPKNKEKSINLVLEKTTMKIYQTNHKGGLGSFLQRIQWSMMRVMKNYSV